MEKPSYWPALAGNSATEVETKLERLKSHVDQKDADPRFEQ